MARGYVRPGFGAGKSGLNEVSALRNRRLVEVLSVFEILSRRCPAIRLHTEPHAPRAISSTDHAIQLMQLGLSKYLELSTRGRGGAIISCPSITVLGAANGGEALSS